MPVRHNQSRGHRANKKQAKNTANGGKRARKTEKVDTLQSLKNWWRRNTENKITLEHALTSLFLLSMGAWLFEMLPLQRTVRALDLCLKSAVFGLGLSFFIIWYLRRLKHQKFPCESLVVVLSCVLLSPPLASLTNRKFSVSPPYKQQYVVVQKLAKESSRGNPYYQLSILQKQSQTNEIHDITMRKGLWDSFYERDNVTCTMHSGLWGFPVIGEIERN